MSAVAARCNSQPINEGVKHRLRRECLGTRLRLNDSPANGLEMMSPEADHPRRRLEELDIRRPTDADSEDLYVRSNETAIIGEQIHAPARKLQWRNQLFQNNKNPKRSCRCFRGFFCRNTIPCQLGLGRSRTIVPKTK